MIDIGCMQINHHYHGAAFASLAAMFDPALNIDYAARFLRDLKARERTWTMAVARYNAGPQQRSGAKALRLRRDDEDGRQRFRSLDRISEKFLLSPTCCKSLAISAAANSDRHFALSDATSPHQDRIASRVFANRSRK